MVGDNDAFSKGIVLRPTCSAHHLQDVLRTQLNPLALLRRVDLSSFDDDRMCW